MARDFGTGDDGRGALRPGRRRAWRARPGESQGRGTPGPERTLPAVARFGAFASFVGVHGVNSPPP